MCTARQTQACACNRHACTGGHDSIGNQCEDALIINIGNYKKGFFAFCLRLSVFAEFSADDSCQLFFSEADSPDRGAGDDDQREEDQTFRRARVTAA